MQTYQPWDFCRSINCTVMIRTEEQRKSLCQGCKAYQMHDYLQKQGLILDEKSGLKEQIEQLERALDFTIAGLLDEDECIKHEFPLDQCVKFRQDKANCQKCKHDYFLSQAKAGGPDD